MKVLRFYLSSHASRIRAPVNMVSKRVCDFSFLNASRMARPESPRVVFAQKPNRDIHGPAHNGQHSRVDKRAGDLFGSVSRRPNSRTPEINHAYVPPYHGDTVVQRSWCAVTETQLSNIVGPVYFVQPCPSNAFLSWTEICGIAYWPAKMLKAQFSPGQPFILC